jgi:D-alanine-D-alanine ligase
MKSVPKSKNKQKFRNQKLIDILGPVENLESYVKADWWKHLFNANYLRTDGDVVGDPAITSTEVDLFESIMQAQKDATILDLCCGQGRHIMELANRGYSNLYGMDRSHYLISRAKATSKKNKLTISFKEGDARKLPFPDNHFAVVMVLGNSFGYFETKSDDEVVLKEISRILMPDGKLIIDLTDGDYVRTNYEPRSWEWIDKNYFVCRERSLSEDNDRLISREVITHVKKGVIADQFYSERLYNTNEIKEMLSDNRFSDVQQANKLNTQSMRNQDLGMMAVRNIIVARAPKSRFIAESTIPEYSHIAVLLGDPNITDKVKPGGQFDDDDFHTINELKKALAKLSHYKVTYLNKHDRFLSDSSSWKNNYDLILNLCDEGYFNKPEFELHIPALLEINDIPYTGGTPQCLAYCYDKSLIRGIASELDIPVANAFVIKPEDTTFIDINISFPVIIKPNFGDSSYGITSASVCANVEQLAQGVLRIRDQYGYELPILIEQFLPGKDISIGIIGNPTHEMHILPVIEEDYSELPNDYPKVCGYEAKWDPTSPYWKIRSVPANLDASVEQYLQDCCLKLFERVGCRDYARFDWRLDANGTPRLLEINPNPGWCWDGHLAKMAKLDNLSYAEMLGKIIEAALLRSYRSHSIITNDVTQKDYQINDQPNNRHSIGQ